jgi:hypothetical protein
MPVNRCSTDIRVAFPPACHHNLTPPQVYQAASSARVARDFGIDLLLHEDAGD